MDRGPSGAAAHRGLRLAHGPQDGKEAPIELATAWRLGLLVLVGFGFGSSAAWGGLYDVSFWGPAAIAVLATALAVTVLSPARLASSERLLLTALVALATLAAVSMSWAQSPPAAAVEAHRWAFYAATFLLVAKLVRDERSRRVLLGSLVVGALVVHAVLIAQLLGSEASSRFFSNRLMFPLGYVNGQAAALAATVWPLVAVAEQARHVASRAAAAATATVLIGLILLTQSRAGLATLAITAVSLVILFPGRVQRAWLLLLVGSCIVLAGSELTQVYSQAPAEALRPDASVVNGAVAHLLLAGAAAGALWAAATAATRRATAHGWDMHRAGAVALVAVTIAGVSAGAVAIGDPRDRLRTQVDQFKKLDASGEGRARLVSGGGNRYDFWRVAVAEFRAHPLQGLGAGNYVTEYYARRRSSEAVRQPHSLPLQQLAELGLAGAATVAALFAAITWLLVGAVRRISADGPRSTGSAVAAGGIVLAWTVHTSVDWLHLLPGLSGGALCAAACLAPPTGSRRERRPSHRLFVVVGCGIAICLAASGIGRLTLAAAERERARQTLTAAADPRRAIELAQRSLELQPQELSALYIQAAGWSRLGNYARARDVLLRASALEPSNPVPRALLGDLATRRGLPGVARREYAAASRLDPRDPALRALAAGEDTG